MSRQNKSHRRFYFLIVTAVIFLFLVSTVPHAQNPQAPPQADQECETLAVTTNLVTINVSVTRKNKPVEDLQANDFNITDQGIQVRPQFFDIGNDASIVFVIDTSASMRGEKWKRIKTGLKEFLKQDQRANYTLVTFNDKPELLVTAASAEEFWQSFLSIKKPDGDTALYDGLATALKVSRSLPSRQKAIVLLSDGDDNRSSASLQTIQDAVYSQHLTVYPIGILLSKREDGSRERAHGMNVLKTLAQVTGGIVTFPTPDKIEKTLSNIYTEIVHKYALSYYPPDHSTGWHSVNVAMTNNSRRLELRYADRYFIQAPNSAETYNEGQTPLPKSPPRAKGTSNNP